MYNLDFKKEFNRDFDKILSDNNNPAINSEEYTTYKSKYINSLTLNNLKYNELMTELTNIQTKMGFSINNNTRRVFTFIDNNIVENTKRDIKQLVLCQRTLLNQFLVYLEKLNNNYITTSVRRETSRSPSIKSIKSSKSRKFKLFRK
jgi:hypothetical protein